MGKKTYNPSIADAFIPDPGGTIDEAVNAIMSEHHRLPEDVGDDKDSALARGEAHLDTLSDIVSHRSGLDRAEVRIALINFVRSVARFVDKDGLERWGQEALRAQAAKGGRKQTSPRKAIAVNIYNQYMDQERAAGHAPKPQGKETLGAVCAIIRDDQRWVEFHNGERKSITQDQLREMLRTR